MTTWLRLDYLLHRWIGTVLGGLVFVWFGSGIVMMYYPNPAISPSGELELLSGFTPDSTLVGFARAHEAAARSLEAQGSKDALVSGRLERLGDRLVYRFQRDNGESLVPGALVDGHSGAVLSPVSPALAGIAAREVTGAEAPEADIELERRADHYMMDIAYAERFPAYRVQFDDPRRTAVYVSARGGNPFGIVTRLTRLTTWTGTVPHWFYFIWLYDRPAAWSLAFVITGSLVALLALTGIVWGTAQLLRRRSRRDGRLSPYRGVSRWHHLSGVVFGLLVLSWTASGVYQNFAAGSLPRMGQAARVRGGRTRWDAIQITEEQALARLRQAGDTGLPRAVDLVQLDGHPGFEFHFPDGHGSWVDAGTGAPRGELGEAEQRRAAWLALDGSAPVERIDRITSYDDYYYARHGREMSLPVWRVTFADRDRTRLYLDPVTGAPTGFVDRASKRARWLRDAVHSFDYGFLNNRRPLWDLVMLPLLLGGLISSGTGIMMLLRRARAVARRAKPQGP